jgi:hypothetical protein
MQDAMRSRREPLSTLIHWNSGMKAQKANEMKLLLRLVKHGGTLEFLLPSPAFHNLLVSLLDQPSQL